MKILEAKDIWDQVVDKYADDGFEDFEFSRHLNTAMALVCSDRSYNRLLKSAGPAGEPVYAFEQSDLSDEVLAPLIERTAVATSSLLITRTQIRATFPDDTIRTGAAGAIVETRKPEIYKLMSVQTAAGDPVYWTRHNDEATLRRNALTRPRATHPHMTIYDDGYRFSHDGTYTFVVRRMPLHCWLSDDTPAQNIDPELPDELMYWALLRAMQLGGIQVREYDFFQAVAANENR